MTYSKTNYFLYIRYSEHNKSSSYYRAETEDILDKESSSLYSRCDQRSLSLFHCESSHRENVATAIDQHT